MNRALAVAGAALLVLTVSAFGPDWASPAFAHGEHSSDVHPGGEHSAGHGGSTTLHGFAAGEPGDAAKPSRTIEIVMNEGEGVMSFAPDRIEANKGEQIKFVIRNAGQLDHEILVDSFANNQRHKAEMEQAPDMDHAEPNGVRLKPAARSELIWRFTKAGTFEFACLIPGHYETGMKGVIVVR